MKLFTVGPVEMNKIVKNEGGKQVPYFRTAEFSDVMLDNDRLLKRYLHTKESTQIIYLTASGTGAMESVVMNCLSEKDKVLVINGGTFGNRFKEICDIHSIKNTSITLHDGEALSKNHLEQYNGCGYTALLVNLHETSSGQLYDINLLSEFCKHNNMYLIVDAISTFLCDKYYMDKNNIDVTIFSSQKGLCVSPGMAMVALNEKIIKERIKNTKIKSLYFNFNDYIDNIQRGQTPFTPAVGVCMQINRMLHYIDNIGVEKYLDEIKNKALFFRKNIELIPVHIPKYKLSNSITPIIFDKPIAMEVFEILKDQYGMIVNPTGGKNSQYILRIAHIGDNTNDDQKQLIDNIKRALTEI